jgi:hypothetical protein
MSPPETKAGRGRTHAGHSPGHTRNGVCVLPRRGDTRRGTGNQPAPRRTGAISASPTPTLPDRWRFEAETARRIGADAQAKTLEKCATDLELREREEQLRLVTLREAEELTGYSYSALEKSVRSGRLPNAGSKCRPRIRFADLPRKAGPRLRAEPGPDLADRVLASRR